MKGGPGFIVAAAFVGPGTVTTCTLAGVEYGMALLWVVVCAIVATILLQEMALRLGLVTRLGLAESLGQLAPPWGRLFAWVAGMSTVAGVVAFEAGNLTGAGLGLASVTQSNASPWTLAVAISAGILLWLGHYRLLERVLMVCVATMGLVFVVTAILVAPNPLELISGLVVPSIPGQAGLIALALIGTTIVPYNLFLHASTVQARWSGAVDLPAARRDLVIAVSIGGVISAAIIVTATMAIRANDVTSATDMAQQLEPLLGSWARVAFGTGFAIAGLTSAITAPLASAYIVNGLLGKGTNLQTPVARSVAIACVGIGAALALANVRPLRLIVFAQAANGLILPIIAVVLVLVLSDRSKLGCYANRWPGNTTGFMIIALCMLLALLTYLG